MSIGAGAGNLSPFFYPVKKGLLKRSPAEEPPGAAPGPPLREFPCVPPAALRETTAAEAAQWTKEGVSTDDPSTSDVVPPGGASMRPQLP